MENNKNIASLESEDFEILPAETRQVIQEVDLALQKVSLVTGTARDITSHISQTIVEVKQLEYGIRKLELQVDLICKEYDQRIEKNKAAALIVQGQLTQYSNRMDQLLKAILEMDPSNKDPDYIKSRSEYISMLNGMSTAISNMFMNFILI